MHFRLSYIPGDFESALREYNSWMEKLISHDWPICFSKRKPEETRSTPTGSSCANQENGTVQSGGDREAVTLSQSSHVLDNTSNDIAKGNRPNPSCLVANSDCMNPQSQSQMALNH